MEISAGANFRYDLEHKAQISSLFIQTGGGFIHHRSLFLNITGGIDVFALL